MKQLHILLFALILLAVIGCDTSSPRPIGYIRFTPAPTVYKEYVADHRFRFPYNTETQFLTKRTINKNETIELLYPDLNAILLCSYVEFQTAQFYEFSEESRSLTYQHSSQATQIKQTSYSNPEKNSYGILYELSGNVATPIQFELTDSLYRFFRGTLLFNTPPNQDSLRPYIDYIRTDIQQLMGGFSWE